MTDKAIAFQKEFKELLKKYNPEFRMNVCPYYGDIFGIEVFVDEVEVANQPYSNNTGKESFYFNK